MKKLLTLTIVFLFGIGFSNAEKIEDNRLYRNYTNNFIFNLGSIEFAVFPDGQFDFNYLQNRNGVNVFINNGNTAVSFNNGYDYNRFVQYDTYGAVIQIEEIPIFYDPYGRVNQIGDVSIFYNNGFVNRIGNLRVYYSRPGVISYHRGYINRFNRFYVYQPWHNYYSVPFVDRCIVYNNPYRVNYYPIRYSWSVHRNYWNDPYYYNGFYARPNVRRNFYRPADQVVYRSFERGRRDARGRAVPVNNNIAREREAISTGRSQVTRSDRGRSNATVTRSATQDRNAATTRSTSVNSRAGAIDNTRNSRTLNATPSNTRSTDLGTTATREANATRSNRSTNATREVNVTRSNRSTTATREVNATRSNRNTNATREAATIRSNSSNRATVNARPAAPGAEPARRTSARPDNNNGRSSNSRSSGRSN
jgi:hypothetical protein